jgi:hypothetical protein
MCFVWISEQTAIISLYRFNWLVFITETECVYCAVRTESLNTHSQANVFKPARHCQANLQSLDVNICGAVTITNLPLHSVCDISHASGTGEAVRHHRIRLTGSTIKCRHSSPIIISLHVPLWGKRKLQLTGCSCVHWTRGVIVIKYQDWIIRCENACWGSASQTAKRAPSFLRS